MAKNPLDLANSPVHLLRRCQQFATDLYTKEMGKTGLTARQFTVLQAVEQHDGASQTDLVNATGIDRSTLADMIARMTAKDLLARKRTEDDQRANTVRLTQKGAKALKSSKTAVARAESQFVEALPQGKRADFLKCLATLADAAGELEAKGAKSAKKSKAKKRR